MGYPFSKDAAHNILMKKRKLLGRGLSFAEKILFLHESEDSKEKILIKGRDQLQLYPDRVLMQDATAQMAMLQFIQTGCEKTGVPATIHCDHLLMADQGSDTDLRQALTANREVYDFLTSTAAKYGLGFWKPGSGMMHQVIFENYAFPGALMIGTDSHTPNAGGLGAIAIGVGGADAAEVMAGIPWETPMPYIVGVKLSGQLCGWAAAKDVIFEMLRRFSVKGGTGKIIEYFGSGAETFSATQKATITNMGAELGATTSVFVYDKSMDAYLRNVGRKADADMAESIADILTQDKECQNNPEKVFDDLIEIDLSTIKPAHAGPFSPDKVTKVKDFRALIESEKWPANISVVLLGSCTNSSYSDLYAAAQILEQARQHGLKPKVPLILSPGSVQIYETIKRDGILAKIVNAGATVLSASCGPCIGQWNRKDVKKGVSNTIFTTFNRNFKGRNDDNPETMAFLTSPAMAAALALAGDARFNPETDLLTGTDGLKFQLEPPHPPVLPLTGLIEAKVTFIVPREDGRNLEVKLDSDSERLQLLKPFDCWDGKDFVDLPVLVKTKGKTTTDHISPGGKWLKFRGHLPNISRNLLAGAVNGFTGQTGTGTNVVTGARQVKLFELAEFYKENTGGFIIIGDENYGEGSSREHAAMSPRFMGVKAVIARSFARIHESNLKKQGVLALKFLNPADYDKIENFDRISIVGLSKLKPGKPVRAVIKKAEQSTGEILLVHTLTKNQIQWFQDGSSLNTIRQKYLNNCKK